MKYILPLFAVTVLAGCATFVDGQTQNVTIKTPGAENARCILQNEDFKYAVSTDETINMMKSPHDFTVNCLAPGNREKTVLVKREINEWVVANVANGFVPGAAYDYFSRGAFKYPETITVSFVGEPVKSYGLPQYHNDDLGHNNSYNVLEDLGPDEKLTEENRFDVNTAPQKTERFRRSEASSTQTRSLNSVVNDAGISRYDPFAKGQ